VPLEEKKPLRRKAKKTRQYNGLELEDTTEIISINITKLTKRKG
jgi:hypothetical protein